MAETDYSNFFCKKRWNLSILWYWPFGLTLLAFIRLPLFILTWLTWLLIPDCYFKKVILKWMWLVLGLHVRFDQELQSMPRVIVCNKTSIVDYIALKLFLDVEFVSVEPKHRSLPLNVPRCIQKDHFIGYLKTLESKHKRYALVQPQTYVATNYNAIAPFNARDIEGIMKAQLVCLSVSRPFLVSAVTVGTNTSIFDILWILFTPMTILRAARFGVIQREEGTSNDALAELITKEFCDYTKLPKLEVGEEAAMRCLSKSKDNVVDMTTINARSNDFYTKLTPTDRFNVRKMLIEKMIEEEKLKYLNRVNSSTSSS